jgi:hypothetical protein
MSKMTKLVFPALYVTHQRKRVQCLTVAVYLEVKWVGCEDV